MIRSREILTIEWGDLMIEWGDLKGAQALFEFALEQNAGIYGPDSPALTDQLCNLGNLLARGTRDAVYPVSVLRSTPGAQTAGEQPLVATQTILDTVRQLREVETAPMYVQIDAASACW